jgi:hypothetical protein
VTGTSRRGGGATVDVRLDVACDKFGTPLASARAAATDAGTFNV